MGFFLRVLVLASEVRSSVKGTCWSLCLKGASMWNDSAGCSHANASTPKFYGTFATAFMGMGKYIYGKLLE